jgi:ApbE superfamily uncharacterized protein (UPF0280 family)
MYQPRSYRHWVKDTDLTSFKVAVKETDLHIRASSNLEQKALELVTKYREMLERYIEQHPSFLTSLEPIATENNAPPIITRMTEAAEKARVGPMAAVAGAIAESVGSELLALSPEVIVENGGDIYLKTQKKRLIGIFAGKSPLSGKVALEINGGETPLGICTSSGTVGHSLSFGKADAAIVLSPSATLADAAATAVGNLVIQPADIPLGIELAQSIEGVKGVVIIKDDKMGLWGEVKVSPTSIED